jgi:hypothetical protein
MFAMVMLTFAVMVITLRARVRAVGKGEIPMSYFSLMSGADIPERIIKTSRHFNNLFEMPVIFYAGCLAYLATDMTDPMPINLAWAFVAARVVHSIIHLSYNNVMHRLVVFGIANLCLLGMWVSMVRAA